MDEELRQAVLAGSTEEQLQAMAGEGGMVDLRQDGIAKAVAGKTSLAEVGRVLYGEL